MTARMSDTKVQSAPDDIGRSIGRRLGPIERFQIEWSLRLHAPEVGRRYLDSAHRLLAELSP